MTNEIEMTGIVMRFGDLIANDHVDLSIEKGEIRALVGENGAGKTTLMRILFGLCRPEAGVIKVRGKEVVFSSPHDAIAQRLGMVHQHFMLFEDLTVTENIVYGIEPRSWGLINRKEAQTQVKAVAEKYGFKIKPQAILSGLSVGEKQRVEILKTLYRGADVIILDEPTAVLTPQERDELFMVLRNLSSQGKTIIIITHKLEEVMELSHRATVLRRGKVIGTVVTEKSSIEELACMMVGREVFLTVEKPPCKPGENVLEVKGLTVQGLHGLPVLDQVSFEVRAGEIVGLAGVAGNGQSELVDTLLGFTRTHSGSVVLNGTDITSFTTAQRRETGIAYIPEDRYRRGLAVSETITDNVAMGFQHTANVSRRGIIDQKKMRFWSEGLLNQFDVRFSSASEPAHNLSGGNLQKVILAREFFRPAHFILADQPTRGVDIGATEFIYQQIVDRRNHGDGILLISADLNEILSIADRILVIFAGKIVGSLPADLATEQEIGLMMGGQTIPEGASHG